MIKIEHSVVIERPIEEVFAFLNDAQNNPTWQSSVLEAKKTSEGDIDRGTTYREVRKFLGQRIESTYEITEHEPNRKLGSKTTSGPIPVKLSTTFESVEGGTKVTVVGEAEPGGFFKLAEAAVSRTLTNSLEADFGSLKAIMEAQA